MDNNKPHSIFLGGSDSWGGTGFIPADHYQGGKWCVELDLRLDTIYSYWTEKEKKAGNEKW